MADLKDREPSNAHIDVFGRVGGVVDRSKEVIGAQGCRVKGISVAEAATDPEEFSNKRDEGYRRLREAFVSQSIMIPDDDELM